MRIVGGQYARRRLVAPSGNVTRPTSDRVREAVFNILQHHDWGINKSTIEGSFVLDACCGTGAMGLEALSRGASAAWFMDKDRAALQALRTNIENLKCQAQCHIQQTDALSPSTAQHPCHLIFLDPPYRENLTERIVPVLREKGWIAPQALLVTEAAHDERSNLPEQFDIKLQRRYGDTQITFYMLL